jgi:hypothetical protein
LLAAPARCPASPTPSSAPALDQSALPPLLELARALSQSIPYPGGQNSSPELPWLARSFSPVVSPSLTPVSWPHPCHRVRRVVFSISNQLRRPRNRRSTHPSQLQRLHRRKEERRRPQPFTPSRFDLPRLILIARPRSRDTASRTRALCSGPSVSAHVPWRWARSVDAPPLGHLRRWPAYQRSPARALAPSTADLISVVGF